MMTMRISKKEARICLAAWFSVLAAIAEGSKIAKRMTSDMVDVLDSTVATTATHDPKEAIVEIREIVKRAHEQGG